MNDDLEAIDGLCAKIIEQRDRIEELEAALREIKRECSERETEHSVFVIEGIVDAALTPEQEK